MTNAMLTTLMTLGAFGFIWIITAGGPGDATQTLPILMYQKAFKNYELGYGTAISMILLLVSAIFGLNLYKDERKGGLTYEQKKREKTFLHRTGHFAVLFILPLCWVILASLDSNANIAAKIPNLTMNNYKDILTSSTTWYSLKNGLILSLGTAILTVVLAGLIAYPLSRYEMKYKKIFMLGMLFMTSLPITTVMVPVYKLFVMVKLYDNLAGVVLFMTAANLPYAIWMMKNFMDSVPISLEEAAWIDGASKLKALTKVVIPLMFAGVSSVGIFVFSNCWGNFQAPFLLLITSEKMPASVTLYRFFGSHTISYGSLAAFSIIYAIPSIILYVLSQKYMSKVLLWKVEQKAEPVIQATCYKKSGRKN